MAKNKRKIDIVAAFGKAGGRATHPHLEPINAASFAADRGLALDKAGKLLAYQSYLVTARAAKARRKTTSVAFERNVLAQARQARDDLDAFTGAALRMTQQVNQTNLWNQTFTRLTRTLRETGPIDVKTMWAGLAGNAQYRSALASHGVSAEMAAAMTEAFTKLDATAALRDGKVSVETRVAGEGQPRRMALRPGPARPANISDLLRRSQFDRVVAALTNKEPVHVEAVPATGIAAYEPADLFAFGAVAARQRMTEHVRKLEDTGLATYEGNDPITFIGALLVIGIFLGLVGSIILELCNHPTGGVEQPEWVCTMGAVLVTIALIVLAVVALIFIVDGVAIAVIGLAAFWLLLGVFLNNLDRIFPDFDPSGQPA